MSVRDILLRLLSVLLLIALNAFFVTAEFSMVSVRRSRIQTLVEAGDVQAQTVQSLQRRTQRLLSTTQLGITLSSLALGWIGENTFATIIARLITSLPLESEIPPQVAHIASVPIAFLSIAYLQIVLGELCPKSVALLYSEQLARFLGPPVSAIANFFKPIDWILNQSTRLFLKLLGIKYTEQGWSPLTPKELQLIVTTERESTGVPAESREILKNVFEFGVTEVVEVMVPRTDVITIENTANFSTLLDRVATTGHSLYPVAGDSVDDIRGIVDFKDFAVPLQQKLLSASSPIEPWVKPVKFVSESTLLSELLPLMQRSRLEMVVVVDEFGGTAGLVTLQDLIDILLPPPQEIESEKRDTDEVTVKIIDEQTFLVQAQMNLEQVNELLDLNLPLTDRYQTLAGFLLYQWQKIPTVGETLHYENLELTVVSASGPRLYQIRIYRRDSSSIAENNNGATPSRDLSPRQDEEKLN
ncbi:MAG: hemolysin family protein [Prochloraceae cyanobacterium]|nr:hemolysin family protein [Prochloraceae cyanobacterium]